MITRKKVEERLMRLDPVEQMLKDAYENGQDMNALPKGRGHIANADYDLSREKNIQITKHCRYAPGRMHDHEFIEISCVFSGACHHDIMIRGQRASLDLREGNVIASGSLTCSDNGDEAATGRYGRLNQMERSLASGTETALLEEIKSYQRLEQMTEQLFHLR